MLLPQLETLPNLTEAERDAVQTLAVSIFIAHSPADPATLPEPYIKCLELGRTYRACVISGRLPFALFYCRSFRLLKIFAVNQSYSRLSLSLLQDMQTLHVGERSGQTDYAPIPVQSADVPGLRGTVGPGQQEGDCVSALSLQAGLLVAPFRGHQFGAIQQQQLNRLAREIQIGDLYFALGHSKYQIIANNNMFQLYIILKIRNANILAIRIFWQLR